MAWESLENSVAVLTERVLCISIHRRTFD